MKSPPWGIDKSAEVYRFGDWSSEYLVIGDDGRLRVIPEPETAPSDSVSIEDIVNWHLDSGGSLPAILRFPGILKHRIHRIETAFRDAIRKIDYRASHQLCFPIKTNQRYRVITSVRQCGVGLEVGTKSELLVGVAEVLQGNKLPLLCNGYKDNDYVEMVLRLSEAGLDITLTLENAGEIETLLAVVERLQVKPRKIGFRVKLNASHDSHWADSAGPDGVFGLSRSELIWAIERLKESGLQDSISMLHYHIGSAVNSIAGIRDAAHEVIRIYSDLVKKEALKNLNTIDVGGGLALHYGSRKKRSSPSVTSENSESDVSRESGRDQGVFRTYSIEEYAESIVQVFETECAQDNIPHPNVISESGRGVAAPHSIFVFQAFGNSINQKKSFLGTSGRSYELESLIRVISQESPNLESARRILEIIELRFAAGLVSIRELAEADRLVALVAPGSGQNRKKKFYYGNLSIFQSLPDVWGIHAMFPVMPIHRLDEQPTVLAGISDITCDSDGRFRNFQTDGGDEIPLHPLKGPNERYLIGVFDVGAYQEAIGDMHNLLAKTSVFSVRKDKKNPDLWDCRLEAEEETTKSVISSVGYVSDQLRDEIINFFDVAQNEGRISKDDWLKGVKLLNRVFNSSPYLNLTATEIEETGPNSEFQQDFDGFSEIRKF